MTTYSLIHKEKEKAYLEKLGYKYGEYLL